MRTASNQPPVVTVSQVNSVISRLIGNDARLGNVAVRGEISNFTRHHQSGHLYFTLKDERTQLSAVMFASNAAELEFEPEALREIAQIALKKKTGARGLRAIMENVMEDIMFDIPDEKNVKKCIITKATVAGEEKPVIIRGETDEDGLD